jgi:ABC-type lipoprotein export system ATPase subunit
MSARFCFAEPTSPCSTTPLARVSGLLPYLTAAENVAFAMRTAGLNVQKRDITARLEELGVAHRSGHFPRELSGGESVRVAVAMALAVEPQLILADEPTGQLDPATAAVTMKAIVKRSIDRGATLLFVTHDVQMAGYAENRLTMTGDGRTAS